LAGSLAASVAAQLGISTDAAKQRLTEAFTRALQSLGTGPPQTNAERAASLVARFRQIAELATRVTNGDPGQPIRQIAGTSLDADSAKANPTPQPDRIIRAALSALAAPASPAPDATTSSSAVPATSASDGRTVALPAAVTAVSTGGDTLLGRILTRAVLSDPSPAAPATAPASNVLPKAAANQPQTAANTTGLAPANPAPPSAPALEAFLGAFASELARTDSNGSIRRNADPAPASAAAGTAPLPANPPSQQPPLPFSLAVASDAAPVMPAPPAPALPQPQHVDANAVVEQILRGMAIRTTDGQSEVRLRLVPESLGDVSVKLIVSGGSVDASITAHTADAQSALAGGANQLAKSLADAGLKLQSFTVGLVGGNFADARDRSRQNDAWTRPGSRRIAGVNAAGADASDDALLAVPSFGPPIYSASTLPGAFNYLA
jgi:Flagellar hook-length control protein FliK